ncbi:MAG: TIGR03560 family F420-dependent LLM class oxidoreductase [Thermoanaerobaculia bacterium]|nr:TIGR03560 family F420-dependent LLM class oxidoreductase [Thermoanaerobaculia bacterium]
MRISYWPSPSLPWQELLSLCRHAEETGWDGIWYADHFMPAGGDLSQPYGEAWTTLAALAASVPRVRIGAMVTGNTYRHPAVLANMAATVDHVSGGRCVLGLGAGWQQNEHEAYGLEFSTVGGRLARLEEACQVIRALFEQERADFEGRFYRLREAPMEPKPLQSPLPLLIGGGGEKVTLKIAARYADEWNYWGDVETIRHKMTVLDGHCRDVGRDPAAIQRSAQALVFLSDDADFVAGVKERQHRMPTLAGDVGELRETLAAYAEAGLDEFVLPDFNLGSREQKLPILDRFIDEVAPAVR